MAIKRRKTGDERLEALIGMPLRRIMRMEPLRKITYGHFGYKDLTADQVSASIHKVNAWKGASYHEKVFVFVLVNMLWRTSETGDIFMSDANYDRLAKHLWEHTSDILGESGLAAFHAVVFDWATWPINMEPPPKLVKLKKYKRKRYNRP